MTPASITAAQLAELLQARLIGDGSVALSGLDAADRAKPGQLTFVRQAKFGAAWKAGQASAVLVGADVPLDRVLENVDALDAGPNRAVLVVPDVDVAMISILQQLMPAHPVQPAGIHPAATVQPGATIHPTASIGPGCYVASGATIGAGTRLIANVSIGHDVRIGERTTIHPNVSIYDRCEIGSLCIIHSGAIIGADGFGYHPRPDGKGLLKIPHVGNVVIHDDVEIGANSCVDRGKFGSTLIGAGTKIDNLVQIGHNCRVGRCCILCGESGLAGSVTLGDGVIIGGRAAIADNATIGSGAKIAGFSGVSGDVPPGGVYMGLPAGPATEWRRTYAFLRRVGKNRGKAGE